MLLLLIFDFLLETFRKLDDIETPLRLFESFFVDVLVDMIVG